MPEPDPVRYRKELKEVSYDVLFDKETKTYMPISAIRKYAYENGINLIDRYKHGYAVRNEDLRAVSYTHLFTDRHNPGTPVADCRTRF